MNEHIGLDGEKMYAETGKQQINQDNKATAADEQTNSPQQEKSKSVSAEAATYGGCSYRLTYDRYQKRHSAEDKKTSCKEVRHACGVAAAIVVALAIFAALGLLIFNYFSTGIRRHFESAYVLECSYVRCVVSDCGHSVQI